MEDQSQSEGMMEYLLHAVISRANPSQLHSIFKEYWPDGK
jgi:hypothetical protein